MGLFKRLTKLFLRISFRYKLMLALLLISCFMALCMGVVSSRLSSQIISDISKQVSKDNINAINGLLNNYFKSVQENLTRIIRLPYLRNVVEREVITPEDQEHSSSQLNISLHETLFLGSKNNNITFNMINFYFKNGFNYSTLSNNELPYNDYVSCFKYFLDNGYIIDEPYTPTTWCESRIIEDNLGRKNNSFLGIRFLYDSVTLEKLGIMVFAIDESDLYHLYSPFSTNAFIINKSGKLISAKDKSSLGLKMKDKLLQDKITKSSLSTTSISHVTGNKVELLSINRLASNNAFFILPFDYYKNYRVKKTRSFKHFSILVMIIGIIAAILFAILLSKSLSSSILTLKRTVQKLYAGDLDARFLTNNTDDVAYLADKFNNAMDKINELFKKQKMDQKAKNNLTIRLMQSQINPHLLYNTLDSVIWALKNEDTHKARKLIISLSNFFKITLSRGSTFISLNSELKMINNYINIQNIARCKNIILDIRIPDYLKTHKIIKLTLQPMVENAIMHGFSGYRDNGTIMIDAKVNNNILLIWVQDNGIGLLPNELLQINKMLNTYPPTSNQKHFGLYNVNRRIKNIFGEKYGFFLESEVGKYTKNVIIVPYMERRNNNLV